VEDRIKKSGPIALAADGFAAAVAKNLWPIDQASGIPRENVRKHAAPDRRAAPADRMNGRRASAQIQEGDAKPS
jgi:hypothetical protein